MSVWANPIDSTALASAARTTTVNSATIENMTGSGSLYIHLNVTAAGAAGGLTLKLQTLDPASGNWVSLFSATAVTTTGARMYYLSPYNSPAIANGVTQGAQVALPRLYRINVTHGNSDSYTYSVGLTAMPV